MISNFFLQGVTSGVFRSVVQRMAIAALLGAALSPSGASQQQHAVSPGTVSLRDAAVPRNVAIGTAAASDYLAERDYSTILGSEFSQLQAENEMKFGVIHPRSDADPNPYDFKGADELVAFAQSHNMLVRGHTLVWHNQLPDWVKNGGHTPSQLAGILQGHIRTVTTHFASKIYAWDVVNEAFNDDGTMRHTVWFDEPGIGAGGGTAYIAQALRWAHEADPAAKLFYNDYNAEVENKKSDAIYDMAKDFRKRGIPLDGIGFQTHVSLQFDDPEKLASYARNLKRFAELGLILHITELDVRLNDSTAASLNAQARLYREITALCLQQPACKLLQTWGFTDKHSWVPGFFKGQGWALLWDADYRKKPAYAAVADALAK